MGKSCFTLATLLVALSSGVLVSVHSFVVPPQARTATSLNLNADDALSLARSGTDILETMVATGEFPEEAKAVAAAALGLTGLSFVAPTAMTVVKSIQQINKKVPGIVSSGGKRSNIVEYPEGKAATYEMNENIIPFEFGDAAFVRPLLKSTQLETRPLQVVYDANKDGYDAKVFHSKVDGKGASVVLAKVAGQWCGGYNPRGWASLGQARSSVAAFLFYKKPSMMGDNWQKIRVSRTGSMACGNDNFDQGICFGADSFIIPLCPPNRKQVSSRLGQYFETCPDGKLTILPRPSLEYQLQELKVLTGVYAPGEGMLCVFVLVLLFHWQYVLYG